MTIPTDNQTASSPFFIVGGTLRRDAPCYVTRAADYELLEALQRGEFCYLLTARQMGKSSLMVQTAARLMESGVMVALLDLTRIGQSMSSEQWYYGLLLDLGSQIGKREELRTYWLQNKELGALQRFLECVRYLMEMAAPARVVVFVDEIDVVRSLPFSTDEFFAGIRDCYNRRATAPEFERITFCLLGVAAPSDLIRDARLTPFNIGRRIVLTDFTLEEALPLRSGLIHHRDTEDAESKSRNSELGALNPQLSTCLLERVLHWTGGHPYLTQRLCQSVSANSESHSQNTKSVDIACADLFFSRGARDSEDNLRFVSDRLLRSGQDHNELLSVYRQIRRGEKVSDDKTDPITDTLRLSGIVRADNGRLQIRNRIYGKVFDEAWVDSRLEPAEARRQRRAYRAGLARASLIFAVPLFLVWLIWGIPIPLTPVVRLHLAWPDNQPHALEDLKDGSSLNIAGKAGESIHPVVEADRLVFRLPRAWYGNRWPFGWTSNDPIKFNVKLVPADANKAAYDPYNLDIVRSQSGTSDFRLESERSIIGGWEKEMTAVVGLRKGVRLNFYADDLGVAKGKADRVVVRMVLGGQELPRTLTFPIRPGTTVLQENIDLGVPIRGLQTLEVMANTEPYVLSPAVPWRQQVAASDRSVEVHLRFGKTIGTAALEIHGPGQPFLISITDLKTNMPVKVDGIAVSKLHWSGGAGRIELDVPYEGMQIFVDGTDANGAPLLGGGRRTLSIDPLQRYAPVFFANPRKGSDREFDFLSQRPITNADLEGKSSLQLSIMLNWPYAKHGQRFHRPDIQSYFAQRNWYRPTVDDASGSLSPVERANVEFIKKVRAL